MSDLSSELDEVLGISAEDVRKLEESRKPSTGIWYYVYLKPKWVLMTFSDAEYGALSHYEAWMKYIVPKLIDHYDIEDNIDDLEDAYRGVPRGRVDVTTDLEMGLRAEGGPKFFLLHGDDFPSGTKSGQLGKIMSRFNLSHLAARGVVVDKAVDHEKMDPEHQKIVTSIVGEVPY